MENIVDNLQQVSLSDPQGQQLTGDGSTTQYYKSSKNHNDQSTEDENHIGDKNTVSDDAKRGLTPIINDDGDGSTDDSDSDESSSEEEEIKAPIELIGEFLHYVRTSDWENAAMLCKMILIYEPENSVALQFQSVIEEKSQIEKELAEMSSSSEDDTSSDEEDTSDEDESKDEEEAKEDEDESPDDGFEPRPGSVMKNPLVFPHHDPVWKP